MKIWDAANGQEILNLHVHADTVWDVAFSPDGRRLASCSNEEIKIWNGAETAGDWQPESRALADRRWPVWQAWEAEDCERKKQWFAAVWHMDQLLSRNPMIPLSVPAAAPHRHGSMMKPNSGKGKHPPPNYRKTPLPDREPSM